MIKTPTLTTHKNVYNV